MDLIGWKEKYMLAGMTTIPLARGTKRPLWEGWQITPPEHQWSEHGNNGNIGILCNGNVSVIDCDSLETIDAVNQRLEAMGLSLPTVETPSKGHHKYLPILDAPKEFNWANLAVGAGELRVKNAYVAAPCSTFEAKDYVWLDGKPEDLRNISPIRWIDLQWLIASRKHETPIEVPPIRLLRREMPGRARYLLNLLQTAHKGNSLDKYESTSEAEAAVIAILLLSGWEFEEIKQVFSSVGTAHYAYQRNADEYLERSYSRVLNWLADTPERAELAEWYQAALYSKWPGRSGALDREVYLGFLAVGWQFSSFTPMPGIRTLAEYAATNSGAVTRSISRLTEEGLLRFISRDKNTRANIYEINEYRNNDHIYNPMINDSLLTLLSNDLWLRIGRSSGLVYDFLSDEPITVHELVSATGKVRNTVKNALKRLEAYNLAESIDGKHWIQGSADILQLMEGFGCEERATARRNKHTRERENNRRH